MSVGVTPETDDQLWSALGDPTRRRLLDLLLTGGDGTATKLSDQLPLSRQAVSKQLAVLTRAGLVDAATVGRERRYRVNHAQLARAVAQLHSVGAAWDARLHEARVHRIKQIAEMLRQG